MNWITDIKDSVVHLIFPHLCEGCGTPNLPERHYLCTSCFCELPETDFFRFENNPVEKLFIGRLMVEMAGAQFYYSRNSLMRKLMHEFKYKSDISLGRYLGRLMGQSISDSKRFEDIDIIIPVPLYLKKQRKRGYNQSTILAESISSILNKPVLANAVYKEIDSESQTKKNRIERWNNAEGCYSVSQPALLENKHILLIDDVVTTGATLEACGRAITNRIHCRLSIAALCFSSGI
jgi:ComF family protein